MYGSLLVAQIQIITCMKGESFIIMSGIIMIISGLVLFYSIQNNPDLDQLLRLCKTRWDVCGPYGHRSYDGRNITSFDGKRSSANSRRF